MLWKKNYPGRVLHKFFWLPDAAGPDQMFPGPDQFFVSEVRKCITTWFSLAETEQFKSYFTLNINFTNCF